MSNLAMMEIDTPATTSSPVQTSSPRPALSSLPTSPAHDEAAGGDTSPTELTGPTEEMPMEMSTPAADKPTPKKRKAKARAGGDDVGEGSAPKKAKESSTTSKAKAGASKPRKKPTKTVASARAIPRSWDEAEEADKMLFDKRNEGVTWPEINVEWERITGDKVAKTTLPNRYIRLQNNFTVIKEEDNPRLLDAKREVETAFEKDKWDLIASSVQNKGGDEFTGAMLKRQYTKLMKKEGIMPPPEINDPDWDPEIKNEKD